MQHDFSNSISHIDLNLYYYGTQDCPPGHFWGPAVKDHYKVHFVYRGKGVFKVGDKAFPIHENQGFLIHPHAVSFYQADEADPWNYSWIAFSGLHADLYLKMAGVTKERPVFEYTKDSSMRDCFDRIVTIGGRQSEHNSLELLSQLCLFFSLLLDQNGAASPEYPMNMQKEIYVEKVIEYIRMNYSNKITVASIADYIGLDRKYLSTLFKTMTNTTIQSYLIEHRLNAACELMKNPHLLIGDIARSVGYDDPLMFSKIFRKSFGLSPREYKTRLQDTV